MEQNFYFTGICRMHLVHTPGEKSSRLAETNVRLEISKNLNKDKYLQRDLPTKEGYSVLQQSLLMGIMAVVKIQHAAGQRDESEHLRWIISELQRAFAHVSFSEPKIEEGLM